MKIMKLYNIIYIPIISGILNALIISGSDVGNAAGNKCNISAEIHDLNQMVHSNLFCQGNNDCTNFDCSIDKNIAIKNCEKEGRNEFIESQILVFNPNYVYNNNISMIENLNNIYKGINSSDTNFKDRQKELGKFLEEKGKKYLTPYCTINSNKKEFLKKYGNKCSKRFIFKSDFDNFHNELINKNFQCDLKQTEIKSCKQRCMEGKWKGYEQGGIGLKFHITQEQHCCQICDGANCGNFIGGGYN